MYIDQACKLLCGAYTRNDGILVRICAKYSRIQLFMQLVLEYGADYNLSKSSIKMNEFCPAVDWT